MFIILLPVDITRGCCTLILTFTMATASRRRSTPPTASWLYHSTSTESTSQGREISGWVPFHKYGEYFPGAGDLRVSTIPQVWRVLPRGGRSQGEYHSTSMGSTSQGREISGWVPFHKYGEYFPGAGDLRVSTIPQVWRVLPRGGRSQGEYHSTSMESTF